MGKSVERKEEEDRKVRRMILKKIGAVVGRGNCKKIGGIGRWMKYRRSEKRGNKILGMKK